VTITGKSQLLPSHISAYSRLRKRKRLEPGESRTKLVKLQEIYHCGAFRSFILYSEWLDCFRCDAPYGVSNTRALIANLRFNSRKALALIMSTSWFWQYGRTLARCVALWIVLCRVGVQEKVNGYGWWKEGNHGPSFRYYSLNSRRIGAHFVTVHFTNLSPRTVARGKYVQLYVFQFDLTGVSGERLR
jgi:hypothetical protein